MSFRSRARALQKLSGEGYQLCLQGVQSNDAEARAFAAEWGWSINRADAYQFDPNLDPEYAAAQNRGTFVRECCCDNCGELFFAALDHEGAPNDETEFCATCDRKTTDCARCGTKVIASRHEVTFCDSCSDYIERA